VKKNALFVSYKVNHTRVLGYAVTLFVKIAQLNGMEPVLFADATEYLLLYHHEKLHEHYFTKWEKKVCIEEHRIRFDHRNGDIFATCELCGTKQAFPYMG